MLPDTETLCILALFPVIKSGYYKNLLPSKDADKPPILLRRGFNIPPGELSALRGTGSLSSISPPERAAPLSDPIWHLVGLFFHFNPLLISFLAFPTCQLLLVTGARGPMGLRALGNQTHNPNPINYGDFINREIICWQSAGLQLWTVRAAAKSNVFLGGHCTLNRAGSRAIGNGICHQFLAVLKKGEEEFALG